MTRSVVGARLAAAASVVGAVVVVAVLMLSGGGSREYTLRFQNAGQLVKGNEVQVAGKAVGSVEDIALTDDNQAEVRIKVSDAVAPLHAGTTAVIRATSLSGIANRYIALSPGPSNAPEIPDGGLLATDKTTTPVDLDQLFNTLDPATRRRLQEVVQGSATAFDGRGEDANRTFKYLSPALAASTRVAGELTRDQRVFTEFVVQSSRVVTAIAERRDDLAQLVGNANATTRAIGAENVALARALGLLPATLRRANTTFVNLRATLDDLDVLVAEAKPATRDLAPFLRELRPVIAAARPTFRDLRLLVGRPGAGNDLVELTRRLPRLGAVSGPAFRQAIRALKKGQPVIEFARPYTPDLAGWFTKFGEGTANYDANGHFARIQPIFDAFSFTGNPAGGLLTPIAPAARANGLDTGNLKRCPGAASQPSVDGSSPFTDGGRLGAGDCDPSQVPPGP